MYVQKSIHITGIPKYPDIKLEAIKVYVLKVGMQFTLKGIYKALRMTLWDLRKKHQVIKNDELSISFAVIGNFSINVKKSNTLFDYMKNTYSMYQCVKSATRHEGIIIGFRYGNTECT